MSHARYIVGDVFDGLASLEPGSVDLVMTSPPFLALRSYLPADHPDKAREIGSEATPGAFIDRMLDVVEACARVLAPHGSLVFELGDTYAGSGGAGGDYNEGGLRDGAPGFDGSAKRAGEAPTREDGEHGTGLRPITVFTTPPAPHSAKDAAGAYGGGANRVGTDAFPGGFTGRRGHGAGNGRGWPLDKSKVLIPQLFAIALAYGLNPLTGRQTEPWRVRNTVAWCRPNPPVGRDGDKFRPATSFLTVACKARDRYWDGDAVRVPHAEHTMKYNGGTRPHTGERGGQGTVKEMAESAPVNPAGAPLLDWWEIPTQPYKGAHYATWPAALVVPVVKSMCPRRVCRVCGQPSRRIVRAERIAPSDDTTRDKMRPNGNTGGVDHPPEIGWEFERETLGWTSCGHDDWRPGIVLDPFAGSGTTLAVATGHGLDAIGIDLDERNAELAYERIGGLLLTIEHLAAETVA